MDKLEFRISFIEVYTYEKEIYIYVAHKQSKITFHQRISFLREANLKLVLVIIHNELIFIQINDLQFPFKSK